MTFNSFKIRYDRAYEKESGKLNVMDSKLNESQLKAAYDTYKNTSLWYHRAFSPSRLANMAVVYYDFQIREAMPGYSYEELREIARNNPQEIHEAINETYGTIN